MLPNRHFRSTMLHIHIWRLVLLCFFVILGKSGIAQELIFGEDELPCGNTFSLEENIFPNSPRVQQLPLDTSTLPAKIIIPVVFHIFHQSRAENIRNEDIVRMIEDCNRQMNLHSVIFPQTPPPFQTLARPTKIELRLAKKDPQGNCTDGIARYEDPLTDAYFSYYCPGPGFKTYEDKFLEIAHWPSTRYLNIYLFNRLAQPGNNSAISGRASFPVDSESADCSRYRGIERDGIFLHFSNGLPYLKWDEIGPTLTHEVGHWLDVYHIWSATSGASSTSCSDTDYCDDTPNQAGASYACFEDYPLFSCDDQPYGNLFTNFMDYGNCKTLFTNDQVTRMHEALVRPTSNRGEIWQEASLELAGVNGPYEITASCAEPPKASIQLRQNNGMYTIPKEKSEFLVARGFLDFFKCADAPAQLDFRSVSTFNTTAVQWDFPGGDPAKSTNFETRTNYSTPGEYTARLIASNAYGYDTTLTSFYIHGYESEANSPDEEESFESYEAIDQYGWTASSNRQPTWEVVKNVGFTGNQSLRLINHNVRFGRRPN